MVLQFCRMNLRIALIYDCYSTSCFLLLDLFYTALFYILSGDIRVVSLQRGGD